MVRCTSLSPPPPLFSVRALPMESTSSIKIIEGACSLLVWFYVEGGGGGGGQTDTRSQFRCTHTAILLCSIMQ
jgi:hypothetical protein